MYICLSFAAEPNSSTDSNILSTKSTVEVLPSTEFSKAHFSLTDWGCHNDVIVFKEYESCHRRILSFPSIPGIPAGASEEERAVKISSLIPLDSQNMVRERSQCNLSITNTFGHFP